jgi:hypothetical protein
MVTDPPVVVALEPLRAHKRAQVLVSDDGTAACFTGIVHSERRYAAEDVAWCPHGCRRPDPACTCGFYALADRPAPDAGVFDAAVLDVDLAGRVIRHVHCLRAELQRVLVARFDPWCTFDTDRAEALAAVVRLWDELPAGWRRVVPVCARHATGYRPVLAPADLAGLLGCEVGWTTNPISRARASLDRRLQAEAAAARAARRHRRIA